VIGSVEEQLTVVAPAPQASQGKRWLAVLLVLQAVWGLLYAFQSDFFADDFLFFRVAREEGLTTSLLGRSAFGHLIPAFHAVNWAFDRFVGADHWWVAAILMVAVYLSITVVVYRIGIRLGAAQPVIALACVFVAFSPFLSTALIWWGAALCLLTSTALNLTVFLQFLRWEQGHRTALVWIPVAYVGACIFWEKSLTVAAFVVLYSILVVDGGRSPLERWRGFWRRWPVWAVLAVPGAVYAGWYWSTGFAKESAAKGSGLVGVPSFVAKAWIEGFWPIAAGTRTSLVGAISVPWWAVALGVVLLVGLVALAVDRVANIGGVASFFLVTFVLNMSVLGLARGGVASALVDPRYYFDTAYLLTMCIVSVRLRPTPRWQGVPLGRVVGSVGVVWVVLALASSWSMLGESQGHQAKAYLARFRSSFDDTRGPRRFVDGVVPVRVILPQFFPYNTFSRALTQIRPMEFTTNPSQAWTVADDGTVVRAGFQPSAVVVPSPSCAGGPGSGPSQVTAPLPDTLPAANWAIQVTFGGAVNGPVDVGVVPAVGAAATSARGDGQPVAVEPGAPGVLVVTSDTPVAAVRVAAPAGQRLCVSQVAVGSVVAQ
jgi:hypothetical protein